MRGYPGLKLTALALLLSGCGSTSTYLSSQQSVYYKETGTITLADEDLKDLFEPKCMKPMPPSPLRMPNENEASQCLYIAVDAAKATSGKTTDRAKRDKAIAYLLGISESNCIGFLERAFASKAGMEVTKNLAQDVSTGVGAIAAFNTPYVTAGLGLFNLAVGKTVDNVSQTYYFDRTFQAFEAAVVTERARIKSDIISKQAQRPTVSTDTAVQYTLVDALADIRIYDAACSMRVGLAKLLETQGEKKAAQFKVSSEADNEAAPSSLKKAKKDTSTAMTADGANPAASAPAAPATAPAPPTSQPAKR